MPLSEEMCHCGLPVSQTDVTRSKYSMTMQSVLHRNEENHAACNKKQTVTQLSYCPPLPGLPLCSRAQA